MFVTFYGEPFASTRCGSRGPMTHSCQASRPQLLAPAFEGSQVGAYRNARAYILDTFSHSVLVMTESIEKPQLLSRKRKRIVSAVDVQETDLPPRQAAKRRKRSLHSLHETSPAFWDNLSRVPLTRRALSEFNRRTGPYIAPSSSQREPLNGDLSKQLKRFARHGGPSLRNIRGVRKTY